MLSFALLAIAIVLLAHFERRPRSYVGARDEWRAAANQVLQERAIKRRINMDWGRSEVKVLAGGEISIGPKLRYRILPNIRKILWPSKMRAIVAKGKARWATLSPRGQRIIRWTVALAAMVIIGILSWRYLGVPLSMPLGAARTWAHTAGNNWNAVGNWDGGATIPQTGDSVTFDATSTASCTVDVATAALIGFTITTGYTGTITVDNAIDTDDLDVDFGGAGTWAGAAAIVLTPGGDISITSDQAIPALTISPTAAAIVTFGGDITVTGATTINTNATVSMGTTTFTANGAVTVNSGGFLGSNTAWVGDFNSATGPTISPGGTISFPNASGSCTIAGAYDNDGTQTANSGTVTFDGANTVALDLAGTGNLYNVVIAVPASNYKEIGVSATIDGTFTTNASARIYITNGQTLTVTGAISCSGTIGPTAATGSLTANGAIVIASGGTIGGNSAWVLDTNSTITVSSGGTISLPNASGTWTAGGAVDFNSGSTVTANSGTMTADVSLTLTHNGTGNLYNVTTSGASTITQGTAVTVANVLTVATTGTWTTSGTNFALTVSATMSITGTLTLNGSVCTFTGDVTINSGGTIGKTSGTGAINTNGNWTVAAGGTLSLTGAGQVFNQNTAAKQVLVSGTIVATGTSGNNIVFNTQYSLLLNTGCTVNLQYVSIIGQTTSDFALQCNAASLTITNLDNLTVQANTAVDRAALYIAGAALLTITNSSFDGGTEATYIGQDILLGPGKTLQLSNCTYTSVGFDSTGWLSSITDQGVANAHVIYGILAASAPDAAYQIADAANVTLKNADAYVVVNNSVLTLDQAETVATLTTSASTTAKLNGNITLTFTTITNDGAFEFTTNTVNAAVLSGGTIGGTAPDMDSGGAGSKVTLTGVTITPALTTGGTGVTITYTGTCVQTGAMIISTDDKVTTATATITYSGTFACTGEIESTGASSITYQDTYTANAGTEDYQAGTVTFDLGTNAYTVTSGTTKFFNLVLIGTNALTLGASNIGCVGISFVASGYTGIVDTGAGAYVFAFNGTGASQTLTFGAQTWTSAHSTYVFLVVQGTNTSTLTVTWGGVTFAKGFWHRGGATTTTQNYAGTATYSGSGTAFVLSTDADTYTANCNLNAAILSAVNGTITFAAATVSRDTDVVLTTGAIICATLTMYDDSSLSVTGAATISCTTWTIGESGGNGATVSITAAPAALTVGTLAISALTAFTLDASFTLAPSTAFTIAATATVTISANKTMVFGGVQPVHNGILVLSSGSILKHAGFSRASTGRVQISRTADFYDTGDLLSDPLPRVLPLAIPPTGYNQMLWEAV